MSFARWTARTRGASSCARTAGAAASAPTTSERARTPRKLRPDTGVRILSAEVLSPLSAKSARVTLELSCAAPSSSPQRFSPHWAAAPAAARRRRTSVSRPSSSCAAAVRTFEPRAAVPRFTLAGVHWRGSGRVVFRTRSTTGRWSAWRAAAPEAEDGPDARSSERHATPWRLGNPWWVGRLGPDRGSCDRET